VVLESFILSKTPYNKLIEGGIKPAPKDEYIESHVLFLDDEDWPEMLFRKALAKTNSKLHIG